MSTAPDPHLFAMATLVQLEREARHAQTREAAGFVMVNRTRRLVPYRLAVLWLAKSRGGGSITAVSGVPHPEPDAPFMQWLGKVLRKTGRDKVALLSSSSLKGRLGQQWTKHAPPFALWLPLKEPLTDMLLGGLWLARETGWEKDEIALAEKLADSYGETLARHVGRRFSRYLGSPWRFWPWVAMALGTVIAVMIPVRLSVTAPAEVVPSEPAVVAAPRDGVIAAFHVAPNDAIAPGQSLFSLEDTEIRARHEVARKNLAVSEAEYHKAAQAAFGDRDSMAEKAILEARIEKARADVVYAAELLERSRVAAPRAGIAVFGDVNDWVGRPVRVGERILTVADPARVEVLVWLPVSDAIVMAPGAEVRLFLNTAPLDSLRATLRTVSYEAVANSDGIVAYRLRAALAPGMLPPRIGLKGTAKVYGDERSLAWFLLRRPMAALRQMVGL